MDEILAGIFSTVIAFYSIDTNPPLSLVTPTRSVTLTNLSSAEADVLDDVYFRQFITTMSQIENNYRKAGTLNKKRLMVGALKGALEYGTGDRYSEFIPTEESSDYTREFIDGEKKSKDGKLTEETFVRWRKLRQKIAYVQISSFKNATIGQFDKAMSAVITMKAKGLIIDLRDNGGGGMDVLRNILIYLVDPESVIARSQAYSEKEVFVRPAICGYYRSKKVCLTTIRS